MVKSVICSREVSVNKFLDCGDVFVCVGNLLIISVGGQCTVIDRIQEIVACVRLSVSYGRAKKMSKQRISERAKNGGKREGERL